MFVCLYMCLSVTGRPLITNSYIYFFLVGPYSFLIESVSQSIGITTTVYKKVIKLELQTIGDMLVIVFSVRGVPVNDLKWWRQDSHS